MITLTLTAISFQTPEEIFGYNQQLLVLSYWFTNICSSLALWLVVWHSPLVGDLCQEPKMIVVRVTSSCFLERPVQVWNMRKWHGILMLPYRDLKLSNPLCHRLKPYRYGVCADIAKWTNSKLTETGMNSFQYESPTSFPGVSSTFKIASHHFHKDHNAPCFAPKIFQNCCSQFLLGITVVPFKMLKGKQGALWSIWKWWMTEESSLSSHWKPKGSWGRVCTTFIK